MVVLINYGDDEAERINNICRSAPQHISFIKANVHGLMGEFFTDYGDEFVVCNVLFVSLSCLKLKLEGE